MGNDRFESVRFREPPYSSMTSPEPGTRRRGGNSPANPTLGGDRSQYPSADGRHQRETHDCAWRRQLSGPYRRGAYMMTAAPARQIAAPSRS